jgi:orotate phosphoribosyltransferase
MTLSTDSFGALPNSLKLRLFQLLKDFALEHKEVTLASGQKSSIYLDCRQVYFRGEAQFLLGELFYDALVTDEAQKGPISACGGMAMGSIPLSCALMSAAFRRGRELLAFAVRKEAKEHGMQASIEGDKCLKAGGRVVILEDVITTGGSAIKAIESLRARGVHVDTLFAIVDREQGGYDNLKDIGVHAQSFFSLKDFS